MPLFFLSQQVKQLQEKSQTKLAIALKELRIKLNKEKAKEIVQVC